MGTWNQDWEDTTAKCQATQRRLYSYTLDIFMVGNWKGAVGKRKYDCDSNLLLLSQLCLICSSAIQLAFLD